MLRHFYSSAIEIDKKYAEAYFQRGVAKLRLNQRGIQDINKALAIDRRIFQAYLTRAAYYGMKKQVSELGFPSCLSFGMELPLLSAYMS